MAATLPRSAFSRTLMAAAPFAVLIAAGALDVQTTAQAGRVAPWCAAVGGRSGAYDCGYYSFEQCMATARGLGGFCSPNPRFGYVEERPRRRNRN